VPGTGSLWSPEHCIAVTRCLAKSYSACSGLARDCIYEARQLTKSVVRAELHRRDAVEKVRLRAMRAAVQRAEHELKQQQQKQRQDIEENDARTHLRESMGTNATSGGREGAVQTSSSVPRAGASSGLPVSVAAAGAAGAAGDDEAWVDLRDATAAAQGAKVAMKPDDLLAVGCSLVESMILRASSAQSLLLLRRCAED